jgi:hypothetical protein
MFMLVSQHLTQFLAHVVLSELMGERMRVGGRRRGGIRGGVGGREDEHHMLHGA